MPKTIDVSIDEYLSTRNLVAKDGIVYRAAKMPKSFDAASRSATFCMTDETVDSYGDIVRAKGADLTRFETNPICLLNHRSDMILGTWSDVTRIVKRIEGKATLAKAGTAPHIDMAYNLMEQGILRGASIGFMPTKVERRLDDNGEPMWSYDILEWQMYECSVVSIPANPNALAKSMADGNMLARDYLEEILDTYIKTPAGVILRISDIEAAFKEADGNKTSAVIEATGPDSEVVDAFVAKAIETDAVLEENDAGFKAHAGGEVIAELTTGPFGVELHKAVIQRVEDGKAAKAAGAAADEPKPELTDEVIEAFVAGFDEKSSLHLEIDPEPCIKWGSEKLLLPLTMSVDDVRVAFDRAKAAALEARENKTGTFADLSVATITLKADTEQLEVDVQKVDGILTRLAKKFPMFFPKAIEERIEPTIVDSEPPEPPTAEAIETVRAKALAARDRLVSKGLAEAA